MLSLRSDSLTQQIFTESWFCTFHVLSHVWLKVKKGKQKLPLCLLSWNFQFSGGDRPVDYVSRNNNFSAEYRRMPHHISYTFPEEMSSGMVTGGFVLHNIIFTMPCQSSVFVLSSMASNLCFKSSCPFKIQTYLRASCAVRWFSLGN